jgi:CHAT domain-containing protein/Tfp pilus assembly protein PilF
MEALKLSRTSGKQSKLQATAKYNEALSFWREISDRYEEARALYCLASVNGDLSNRDAAIDFDLQALEIHREIGNRSGEAFALRHLGYQYLFSDQLKARQYLNRALPIWQGEGDKLNTSITITNIGASYENLGDLQTALDYYNQSLALRQEVKDSIGVANLFNNIGLIYDRMGEPQEALRHYQQAIDILKGAQSLDSRGRKALAGALNNTGYVHLAMGSPDIALRYCSESLPLQREGNYPPGEIASLLNIGQAHLQSGDPRKALGHYEQAHETAKQIKLDWDEAYALLYKGEAHVWLGEPSTAMAQYLPALDIFRKIGDREGEANALNKIAAVFASQGNLAKAMENYRRALDIWQAIRDPRGEAASLYGIARTERARGRFDEAHKRADEAIKKIESLRAKVVSQQLRTSYLASVRDYYDLDIDLLMQLHRLHPSEGYDERALRLSEQARSRSLLESIAEVGKDIREGVDPDLLEREIWLRRQIEAKSQHQVRLLSEKKSDEQVASVEKELQSLIEERRQTEEKIRERSPRYAALVQPQPVGLDEIRSQLLDPQTLLLEYSLGEERSYLWIVSQSEIRTYTLPPRAVIESAAREVYNLISTREATFAATQERYWTKAARLSRIILGPAASHLGDKRLLIVAEGALQYISFPALPVPFLARKPLLERHEIIHPLSASVIVAHRREMPARRQADKLIAVFADPVFDKNDERVLSAGNRARGSKADSKAMSDLRGFDKDRWKLGRLEHSRREAEAIGSLSRDALIALDFDARAARAKERALGDYRILHFATHGLIDSRRPDLSRIVLSLVDENGDPQDGFLRLDDIYNLRLSAELVVLSACETALGKDIRGEGLVGLTRGFLYAGASRVMASLWKVDDERTAELMKRFYEKVLRENLQPAAALRSAQIEMWRSRNNSSPFYWGAFIMQGDWKDRRASGSR